MRIGLFTDTYYPELNGVANSTYQLKKELEARGNEVYVFTVTNPDVKEPEPHVYRMRSLPCPLLRERRVGYSLFHYWFPLIESLHLDIIHTQTEFSVGHIGRRAAEALQIPLVHTYHTIYEDYTHYLRIPGNGHLKGVVRELSRFCCEHADQVIVPTDKVRRLLDSYGVQKPVQVQPTGISLAKFQRIDEKKVREIRGRYGIQPEHHVLVSIGRLSEEKNLREIICHMGEIVKFDKLARLLVVGDGPERTSLEELATDRHLEDHVIFTGQADWDEIQNYYAAGDVFTCASNSETQGLTYAEALACGKPLLVKKDECLENLLEQGVNGYAYETEPEFLENYQRLFQDNAYRNLEFDARKSVRKLSAEAFGEHVEQLYREVLERKSGSGFRKRMDSAVG